MTEEIFVNKVAESGLVTIDLEDFYIKETVAVFDLKPYLFMELILKEKDFRAALLQTNWSVYNNKYVAITCTADAIIPQWAYMLVVSYLQPICKELVFGTEAHLIEHILLKQIQNIPPETYLHKRVVVKGCGDVALPTSAYVAITALLMPVVKSIMYGEPCSTVPIFKRKS